MSDNKKQRNKVCDEVLGKAKDLAKLVDYSDGSVVSKTLIDKGTGNIAIFSFDAGQGLSEHTSPFDAVVQVVDGSGSFVIGGKPINVTLGQMLIMPANVPHSVEAKEKFKMLLTMIRV